MPRISSQTIVGAYRRHPLLPLLLQECRTLDSAQNELRWLRQRACSVLNSASPGHLARSRYTRGGWRSLLRSMCRSRSKGVPLQYILGDQPFGDLEILCKRGVLIPRAETEAFATYTANLVLNNIGAYGPLERKERTRSLRIIDLCTGTGCISLLLHALLAPSIPRMSILGIDISHAAIKLATRNLIHNHELGLLSDRANTEISFRQGDALTFASDGVLGTDQVLRDIPAFSFDEGLQCDVIIANPPYISPTSFWDGTTARSVRIFEPTLALVPPAKSNASTAGVHRQEDLFYYHIVQLSLNSRAKITVLECGCLSQARRVAAMARDFAEACQQDTDLVVDIWPGDRAYADNYTHLSADGPHAVILKSQSFVIQQDRQF